MSQYWPTQAYYSLVCLANATIKSSGKLLYLTALFLLYVQMRLVGINCKGSSVVYTEVLAGAS